MKILSFTAQRKLIIDFLKSQVDNASINVAGKTLTKEHINMLEYANNKEFSKIINLVTINKSKCQALFSINYDTKRKNYVKMWVTKETSTDVKKWEKDGEFKNINIDRMNMLKLLFESIVKTDSQTKKNNVEKIGKYVEVQQNIAFIDTEDYALDHAMYSGGSDLDLCWDAKSQCNKDNEITHVINSYMSAIIELIALVIGLKKAKKKGAKFVIDTAYCERKEFKF